MVWFYFLLTLQDDFIAVKGPCLGQNPLLKDGSCYDPKHPIKSRKKGLQEYRPGLYPDLRPEGGVWRS